MAKLIMKRAKGFGSVEVKGHTGKITDAREVGEPREVDGTVVTALAGVTVSENYNSMKVEVGISIPTVYGERERVLEDAWEFIDKEIADKMHDAKKLLRQL